MAYVDPERLTPLLQRMWVKVDASAKAYRAGVREDLPYVRDCCYCEEP